MEQRCTSPCGFVKHLWAGCPGLQPPPSLAWQKKRRASDRRRPCQSCRLSAVFELVERVDLTFGWTRRDRVVAGLRLARTGTARKHPWADGEGVAMNAAASTASRCAQAGAKGLTRRHGIAGGAVHAGDRVEIDPQGNTARRATVERQYCSMRGGGLSKITYYPTGPRHVEVQGSGGKRSAVLLSNGNPLPAVRVGRNGTILAGSPPIVRAGRGRASGRGQCVTTLMAEGDEHLGAAGDADRCA